MIEIDIEKINRMNFRSCLSALSQPGSIYLVQPLFDAALLAMASVLLYNEVGYHYDGELDFQMISALTGAEVQPIELADYLFFDAPNTAVLKEAKTGTTENPESSASLLFQCEDVTDGIAVNIAGPGIDGSLQARLPVEADFVGLLQEINSEFPTGLDLFFLDTHNRLLGLPRTTIIEVFS